MTRQGRAMIIDVVLKDSVILSFAEDDAMVLS